MRPFRADLRMMAESTGGMTVSKADEYGADIELLAQHACLSYVDVTLLSCGVEQRAVRYTVNSSSGALESSRPGGVLWPRVSLPELRVVISYTEGGNDIKNQLQSAGKLKIGWAPTSADISHSSLSRNGGRSYISNGYGLNREDYS
jgi:hypothetical protein